MKKLLCIEDDYSNAFVVKAILEGLYAVDVVTKPQQALEALQTYPYQAALVDINLGRKEMSGIELIHKMGELPGTHRPFLIATTAYAMPGEKEQILASGFDHYLAKPLDRQELLSTLEHAFQQSSHPNENV